MARIRTIKPEFFRHEGLYEAEKATGLPLRVAFAGLWTVADREGRFRWAPRALKLDCLPYDEVDFDLVLRALVDGGFIQKYEHAGNTYGCVPSWSQHQAINQREQQSTIPAPPNREPRTADDDQQDTCMHVQDRGEGKGREGEGIDRIGDARATATSAFTDGSKALASAFWQALGYDDPLQIPPEFAGVDWRALEWERAGWTIDLIGAEARRLARDRPLKPLTYFEKVFATAFAKRKAPLPVVEVREAEQLTVIHGKNQPRSGSLIAAIDRELANLQSAEAIDSELPKGTVLRLQK